MLVEDEATHQHSSKIASFREMLDQAWMVKVEHIYRRGNRATDHLASLGHELSLVCLN
ncbi:hypothetical protein LINPERHAP2_LOCUS29851 [Linum perenne]